MAIIFDNDDIIPFGYRSSLDISGPITFSCWVKTISTAIQYIIMGFNTASPFNGYAFVIGQGGIAGSISFWDGGSGWNVSNVTVHDGFWHMATITWEGTNAKFYKDGVFDVSRTVGSITTFNGNKQFGRTSFSFIGNLSDMRIYNRVLAPSEIFILYNSKLKNFSITKGLVGYWPLNEGVNGSSANNRQIFDLSGNENHGIANNGANGTGLIYEPDSFLSYI